MEYDNLIVRFIGARESARYGFGSLLYNILQIYREQTHYQKHLYMVVLFIEALDIQLCPMNYDCVFKSYDCVL